ncbi:MAG TPA: helix-turn-helix transcriptional regulator [Candidatus Dormibacteraeota bacterium]
MYDRAALCRVMEDLIARYESEPRLAKATGISQSYLSKLRNGKPKSLGRDHLRRLLRIASRAERAMLDHAFTSPTARALYSRYVGWLKRELRDYGLALQDAALTATASGEGDWHRSPRLAPTRAAAAGHKSELLPHLLSVIRQRNGEVFRRRLKSVESGLANSPDGRYRLYLALLRVAAPLVASLTTQGIEVSFQELERDGQLEAYLDHALAAQVILLRHEGGLVRARQLAAPATDLPRNLPKNAKGHR